MNNKYKSYESMTLYSDEANGYVKKYFSNFFEFDDLKIIPRINDQISFDIYFKRNIASKEYKHLMVLPQNKYFKVLAKCLEAMGYSNVKVMNFSTNPLILLHANLNSISPVINLL